MTSFPVDKKRIMVAQDIQAETASPSTSRKDKKVEETKGPEYYVKKLSDTSKGINAKVVSHLAVGLRTMPLRYVMSISSLLYLLSDKKYIAGFVNSLI